jgi:hypothetical protein
MKRFLSLTAIGVALLLVALPLSFGQGQAPAPAEKTFEGQLTKVDTTAKTLAVKGSAAEMLFQYTDKTQVLGPEKDIQGLAGKSGTPVRITYREAGNNYIATRIEVAEKR